MLYALGLAAKIAGVLGVGGMIAAFIFAPAVATIIVQRLEKLASAVLSTRIGCALVVGALAFGAGDLSRRLADAGRCDAAIAELKAKAEAAAEARDTDIRKQVEAEQAPVIAELRKQAEEALGEAQRYEKERLALVAASGGKCVLDAGALRVRNRAQGPPAAVKR